MDIDIPDQPGDGALLGIKVYYGSGGGDEKWRLVSVFNQNRDVLSI